MFFLLTEGIIKEEWRGDTFNMPYDEGEELPPI